MDCMVWINVLPKCSVAGDFLLWGRGLFRNPAPLGTCPGREYRGSILSCLSLCPLLGVPPPSQDPKPQAPLTMAWNPLTLPPHRSFMSSLAVVTKPAHHLTHSRFPVLSTALAISLVPRLSSDTCNCALQLTQHSTDRVQKSLEWLGRDGRQILWSGIYKEQRNWRGAVSSFGTILYPCGRWLTKNLMLFWLVCLEMATGYQYSLFGPYHNQPFSPLKSCRSIQIFMLQILSIWNIVGHSHGSCSL